MEISGWKCQGISVHLARLSSFLKIQENVPFYTGNFWIFTEWKVFQIKLVGASLGQYLTK